MLASGGDKPLTCLQERPLNVGAAFCELNFTSTVNIFSSRKPSACRISANSKKTSSLISLSLLKDKKEVLLGKEVLPLAEGIKNQKNLLLSIGGQRGYREVPPGRSADEQLGAPKHLTASGRVRGRAGRNGGILSTDRASLYGQRGSQDFSQEPGCC